MSFEVVAIDLRNYKCVITVVSGVTDKLLVLWVQKTVHPGVGCLLFTLRKVFLM